jgi:hypothetical protein
MQLHWVVENRVYIIEAVGEITELKRPLVASLEAIHLYFIFFILFLILFLGFRIKNS